MDIKDIKDLIITINNTNIETVEIQQKDFRIMVTKGKVTESTTNNPITKAPQIIEAAKIVEEVSVAEDEDLFIVKSPMIGTFYRASSPDSPPFAKIGDKIEKGQTLCIVEAMKIMNEIESEISGEVVDILINDEDIVEYGQALMKIRR